ncbi:MAG: NAD-dependent deacylase [Marinospirillum sp.]|uniref:NAD-dependent deacylase n=1 Tax=Marinospirillum sp. TaxID=2183934 RepID=UPI001A0854D6|nr:NAD-dependent deacylase [Marinospirillum sp.]
MKLIYPQVVVLTGAGISAESGISTFRDQNGLWQNHRIEEVASPDAFRRNPAMVHQFYNQRRAQLQLPEIQPNAAHLALVEFEKVQLEAGGRFTLISQNVDDLHQRAGSQNLLSMHGQLLRARCSLSGQTQAWSGTLSLEDKCSCCEPAQALRPDIVWFGETPYHLDACYKAVEQADLFISIGTSGRVYPAAGFLDAAESAYCIELNMEKTSPDFEDGLYGPATQVVPSFFHFLIEQMRSGTS